MLRILAVVVGSVVVTFVPRGYLQAQDLEKPNTKIVGPLGSAASANEVIDAWTVDPLGTAARADEVINVWTGNPPGPDRQIGQEQDFTKPTDKLIAGERIIKLGNVATPQLHVFHPPEELRNGAAVVVCPGGGFHILAWDLEGTEVAKWLNSLGVTAIVLKYRVPTNRQKQRWLAPVQDTQRAISIVRSNSDKWKLKNDRIGVLGFSAGGCTAAFASFGTKRFYEAAEEVDQTPCRPDFSVLIYSAGMTNEAGDQLNENFIVNEKSPPTFMAHAFDDFVPIQNCLVLMEALKKAKVASELHIYDRGGHGYGLRTQRGKPVTSWATRCGEWLATRGLLEKSD